MSKIDTQPLLFEPIQLRGVTATNRLWVAAMCQYSCMQEDGMPQPWHMVHLGSFAVGRAGLIISEATAVRAEGRISPHDVGIWNDEQAEAWKPIIDFVHSQGVPIAVQLAHAGRKASMKSTADGRGPVLPGEGGWQTVGPSPVAFGRLPEPRELATDEIPGLIADFAEAARRAVEAGFDAIEIHGAHGYLFHAFLSPLSNQRVDRYGGSFENRARLLLETVDAIRAVIPETMPLFVRLSATDWIEGGWNVDETVRLTPELESRGVDFISISSGGNDHRQQIPVRPGYQVPFARAVKEVASVPVGAAGFITTPQQAESLLVDGAADVVFAARQFLREAKFPLRAAAELGAHLEWPRQYRTAKYEGSIP